MKRLSQVALVASALLAGTTVIGSAIDPVSAHGDVTPQAVDTSALPDIGTDWLMKNPYADNATAIAIGQSAYGQNCARCHGLDAESGGIAPDLRYLELGESGDEWYIQRYQHGASHDGKVYMPPFGEVLGQKTGWAIRSWLVTKHQE